MYEKVTPRRRDDVARASANSLRFVAPTQAKEKVSGAADYVGEKAHDAKEAVSEKAHDIKA